MSEPAPDHPTGSEHVWQLQEAKQRFSELVRGADAGVPQIVTRHGQEVAAVIPIEQYRDLHRPAPDLKSLLTPLPDAPPLDITRARDLPRTSPFE